jgi:NADPH-dependent 2,4-dienoyl-CoA reductase/sulfur reductase-like enzyme
VTVLLADSYPNYSICGLPYSLSGDVPDWRSLAHRTVNELEQAGIELLLEQTATRIDAHAQTITARDNAGRRERELGYDKLLVATGAQPIRPPIPGIESDGVYQLHTIGDSLALDNALARHPASDVIVGAGYIGLANLVSTALLIAASRPSPTCGDSEAGATGLEPALLPP